jgi:hypothetical protein
MAHQAGGDVCLRCGAAYKHKGNQEKQENSPYPPLWIPAFAGMTYSYYSGMTEKWHKKS